MTEAWPVLAALLIVAMCCGIVIYRDRAERAEALTSEIAALRRRWREGPEAS